MGFLFWGKKKSDDQSTKEAADGSKGGTKTIQVGDQVIPLAPPPDLAPSKRGRFVEPPTPKTGEGEPAKAAPSPPQPPKRLTPPPKNYAPLVPEGTVASIPIDKAGLKARPVEQDFAARIMSTPSNTSPNSTDATASSTPPTGPTRSKEEGVIKGKSGAEYVLADADHLYSEDTVYRFFGYAGRFAKFSGRASEQASKFGSTLARAGMNVGKSTKAATAVREAEELGVAMGKATLAAAHAGDVGVTAAKPSGSKMLRNVLHGVSFAYVIGDVYYDSWQVRRRYFLSDRDLYVHVAERFTFQVLASLVVPSLIIHQVVHWSSKAFEGRFQTRPKIPRYGPLVLGLATVPVLPYVLDQPLEHTVSSIFAKVLPTKRYVVHTEGQILD
jgi:hypothetical protein